MTPAEFEQVVVEAMEGLPPPFRDRLQNVGVMIQPEPASEHRRRLGDTHSELFGLYEGIPYPDRVPGEFTGSLPSRITIFQRPIERIYRSRAEMIRCIQETVLHEVGHHFGFTDDDLERMGY